MEEILLLYLVYIMDHLHILLGFYVYIIYLYIYIPIGQNFFHHGITFFKPSFLVYCNSARRNSKRLLEKGGVNSFRGYVSFVGSGNATFFFFKRKQFASQSCWLQFFPASETRSCFRLLKYEISPREIAEKVSITDF